MMGDEDFVGDQPPLNHSVFIPSQLLQPQQVSQERQPLVPTPLQQQQQMPQYLGPSYNQLSEMAAAPAQMLHGILSQQVELPQQLMSQPQFNFNLQMPPPTTQENIQPAMQPAIHQIINNMFLCNPTASAAASSPVVLPPNYFQPISSPTFFATMQTDPSGHLIQLPNQDMALLRPLTSLPAQPLTRPPTIYMDGSVKKCVNCKAIETPTWRRHPATGSSVCNACGLYFKLHKRDRMFTINSKGNVVVKRQARRSGPPRRNPGGRGGSAGYFSAMNDAGGSAGVQDVSVFNHYVPPTYSDNEGETGEEQ